MIVDTIKILLVDDEEILLEATKLYLEMQNESYNITTVNSANNALKLLRNTEFDLIISDYQMPEMDGLEFLESVKNKNKYIPFIIFTGRGREEVAIQALNLGADYYLQKGGDPKSQFRELVNLIDKIITKKKADNEILKMQNQYISQLKGTPIPMFIWESKNNEFELVNINEAAINELEIKNQSVIGLRTIEYYRDNPKIIDLIHFCYKKRTKVMDEIYYLDRNKGLHKWFRIQCVFIPPNQVLVTKIDLTELKIIERRNHLLNQQLLAINDFALAIGETNKLEEVYKLTFSHLQKLMSAHSMIISLYDEKNRKFTAGYAINNLKELDVTQFPPIPLNEDPTKGTQSKVIHTGKIYYAEDLQKAVKSSNVKYTFTEEGEVIKGFAKDLDEELTKSGVYIPMKSKGKIIGVLIIQKFNLNSFKQVDLDLLQSFANVASIGIENAKLIQNLLYKEN